MARKKITLAFVARDSARKAAFRKRKLSLLRKMSELVILCAVKGCIIVYGHDEIVPAIWPSEPEVVREVIQRFNELPVTEKTKKMIKQDGFLKQIIAKMREQHAKLCRENTDLEMKLKLMQGFSNKEWLDGVGLEEVHALSALVDAKLAALNAWHELLVPRDAPTMSRTPP